GGAMRLLLESRGWTFEPVWQSASFTMAMVWVQNGVWIAGSALVLALRRDASQTEEPPLAAAAEGRPRPAWERRAYDRSLKALLGDVGAGIVWGFLLLFVNGFAARAGMALWERILSPEQL